MPKRILVPLDQTAEAERIVPVVVGTARGCGASVRLLHVAPDRRFDAEARDYLAVVELAFDGVPVEIVVRYGTPAEEVLYEANEFGADLIAVTTGSGTPRNATPLGRVAEALLRRAAVPVLLLRPER